MEEEKSFLYSRSLYVQSLLCFYSLTYSSRLSSYNAHLKTIEEISKKLKSIEDLANYEYYSNRLPITDIKPLKIPINYLKAVFCVEYSQTLSSVGKNKEAHRLLEQSKALFKSISNLPSNEEYIYIYMNIYIIIRKKKNDYLELINSLEKSTPQSNIYIYNKI